MGGAERPIRVLVAKPGLDGHDRGAKVVAKALMEAGMEVIYTGRHQTVEDIVSAAVQEDVDVVGLSILSGAHLGYAQKVVRRLAEEGAGDKMVIVGGTIPRSDVEKLTAIGVKGVFPSTSRLQDIVRFITDNCRRS